jgi:hypothetical protein
MLDMLPTEILARSLTSVRSHLGPFGRIKDLYLERTQATPAAHTRTVLALTSRLVLPWPPATRSPEPLCTSR